MSWSTASVSDVHAIEVMATGVPSVPMAATAPASPKFTPAALKRPIDVQKANAVASLRSQKPNENFSFVLSGTERTIISWPSRNIAWARPNDRLAPAAGTF
jgi:hypothetical protein